MIELLEWLLGLEHISLRQASGLTLRWQLPAAAWVMAVSIIVLLGCVIWIYRSEGGRGRWRWLPAGLRAALVLLIVIVVCQPVLVLERTRIEPSYVALLVDASSSMDRADRYYDADEALAAARVAGLPIPADAAPLSPQTIDRLASSPTRFELFASAATTNNASFLRTLLARNRLHVYTFSARAEPLLLATAESDATAAASALADARADGSVTDVVGAIDDVLKRMRGLRLSAIVLASDGVSTVAGDLRTAGAAAAREHVPIHTVLLGSSIAPRDIRVGPVLAEETVFVKDLIAVSAPISAIGYDQPLKVAVSLTQEGRSLPLATEVVTVGGQIPETRVELRTQPQRGGKHRYRVAIEPRPDEHTTQNNSGHVDVLVVDDKIRVLFVDDEPRYEYRYLKSTLVREETVVSSCLLLAADETFPQEGDEPIQRFPISPEELFRYDVVLFGDVDLRAGWITAVQQDLLREFVGERGGGFGVIAGPLHGLGSYRGAPLEPLLPVRIDASTAGRPVIALTSAYQPALTAEGRLSTVFRLETRAQDNLETIQQLPGMYWMVSTLGPKPGAEVLAEHPTAETLTGGAPLVVVGRYGAGRTFFQAVDETWRWREHTGEGYFDAYWLNVIRYLARTRMLGHDRRFELVATPARADYGQPVTLQLTVYDSGLSQRLADALEAEVVDPNGYPTAAVSLARVGSGANRFEGTFMGSAGGAYTVSVRPERLAPGESEATTTIIVDRPDLESRVWEADHGALRQLSGATEGGRAIRVDQLATLAAAIEDRSVAVADDLAEPLWDTKLVLVLFGLIIVLEWVIRKSMDLV